MSKSNDKEQLWVRFPGNEAKLCIMNHEGRSGLLLLHKSDDAGTAVRHRASAMGFKTVRMKSGALASMFMRQENGYPFGIRALAEGLGGVAKNVSLAVIMAEAFPRQPQNPTPQADVTKTAAPEEPKEEPKKIQADPSVAAEISAFLSGMSLLPDPPESKEPDEFQPELF